MTQDDRIELMLLRFQSFMDELVRQYERRPANSTYEIIRGIIAAWHHARRATS